LQRSARRAAPGQTETIQDVRSGGSFRQNPPLRPLLPVPPQSCAHAEPGGKRHEMPCHHNLETYLHAECSSVRLFFAARVPSATASRLCDKNNSKN
jgi:hypothetical protein